MSKPPRAQVRVIDTTPPAARAPRKGPKATAAPGPTDEASASRQRDPFERLYGEGLAIMPPLSYAALTRLHDESDALVAAVAAMETNIAGFGVQFVARKGPAPDPDAAAAEKDRLETFFRFASAESSFTALRRRTRVDLELFGDGYWEMLRDAKGALCGIEHMRAYFVRKGKLSEPVEVERWVPGEGGAWVRRKAWRRFRLFVEVINGTYQWFKQWGDPRVIRASDGKEDPLCPKKKRAGELFPFTLYATDTPYGKPRWRGTAVAIAGRTAASEINFQRFDQKAIPPTLITVSGAALTEGSVDRIKSHFASLRGRENFHAPLVLEAVPEAEGMTGDGPLPATRIGVHDLTGGIAKDGQFLKYRDGVTDDVGMSFRLPRIYTGRSADYNRATAEAAARVAEEQVFAPERGEEQEMLNREVMPELGALHWEVRASGPPLLSEETIIKLLEIGIAANVVTAAQVAEVLEPLLGQELSRAEAWAHVPAGIVNALLKAGVLPPEIAEALRVDATPTKPRAPAAPATDLGADDAG